MSWAETKVILDTIVANGIGSANGAVIMIPMDANKYGYNLRMWDIDGVTPLADVKINGVSDPNSEIRTNANGVAKFISGSPTHSISFSEFPSGYQYADVYTARTIRGYINDMTEVVVKPDIATFAGFNVTLLKNDGTPATNATVTCSTNGKQYRTNGSGQISGTIYAQTTSLTFTWEGSPNKYAAADGVLQYIYNTRYTATVSGGTIGQTKSLTSANASVANGTQTGYRINAATTVGSEITIGSKVYIIAHVDSSLVYAVLKTWERDEQWSSGTTDYAQSTIKDDCTSWYNSNVPSIWRTSANAFSSVTTEGVSSPCFIPTYNQVNGGWSYFNSNDHRIFRDSNNTAKVWWTSTESSGGRVWFVYTSGNLLNYGNPTTSFGFRPALAIKRSLFN